MNKSLSMGMIGAGLIVIVLSFAQVRAFLKLPIPEVKYLDLILMIAGAALAAIGAFLISKASKPEQPKEIPIYEGTGKQRKVVALQRMGKE